MPALHLVSEPRLGVLDDAAMPQGMGLGIKSCQSGYLWAIVHTGRTQAVCTSRRGRACRVTLQEHRSRGCRAPKSFCRCAWLPSWLPALRAHLTKLSTSKSRPSRSSRPTPASTTKTNGRATWAVLVRPALFLSAGQHSAAQHSADSPTFPDRRFEVSGAGGYAAATSHFHNRRLPCATLPLSPCLPLQRLQPAPSPHPSPSRCPSPSSRFRTANTAPDPTTERARRVDRQPPVPALRAPEQKVRSC